MEVQTLAMANSTVLQLFFTVVVVLCNALLLAKVKKNKNSKRCKPVMETGREKGDLVLGNYTTKLCKPVMEKGRDKGELVLRKYYISNLLLKAAWNGPK